MQQQQQQQQQHRAKPGGHKASQAVLSQKKPTPVSKQRLLDGSEQRREERERERVGEGESGRERPGGRG